MRATEERTVYNVYTNQKKNGFDFDIRETIRTRDATTLLKYIALTIAGVSG